MAGQKSAPVKVASRITSGVKRFQPIIESAKKRDVNESDTASIVADILADVFGFDKYHEVTSEYSIRGTYCDLAIKIDNKIEVIIEVKAIGIELKEAHAKQAVDYAANQGTDWVILTNGVIWKVYSITFSKPIAQELVLELNFLEIDPKTAPDLLYMLSKEGFFKSVLDEYYIQKQATNRFTLGALILSEPVLKVIKRELSRISPQVRASTAEIKEVLTSEVIKREVVDGDEVAEEMKKIEKLQRTAAKRGKPRAAKSETQSAAPEECVPIPQGYEPSRNEDKASGDPSSF